MTCSVSFGAQAERDPPTCYQNANENGMMHRYSINALMMDYNLSSAH